MVMSKFKTFLKDKAKGIIKKHKYLIVLRAILHGRGLKTRSGTAHKKMNLDQSLEYIRRVFSDYLKYADLNKNDLQDKTILEVGPGDNLGVALCFIAQGAKKIVCLDRFYSERDNDQQLKIYKALINTFDAKERKFVKDAIKIEGNTFQFNPEKIDYIYGVSVEEAYTKFESNKFDFIVSRAVLEHIYDSDKALESMHKMLKSGGRLVHKVDLRDHKMFSEHGMSELEFLTIPDYIWRWVSPHGGKVNRNRIDFYRKKLAKLNYSFRLFITHVVGHNYDIAPHKLAVKEGIDFTQRDLDEVNAIKPKMVNRFRALSQEDLLVTGIFMIAKKNGQLSKNYDHVIEELLPKYFPEISKSYQITKKRRLKKNSCSIIDEWQIADEKRKYPTLMIKKSRPNDLYNDNLKVNLAKEYESLKLLNRHRDNGFSVPKAFDYIPEHDIMVMEKIEARTLGEILLSGVFNNIKYKEEMLELLFRRCGQWLQRFHEFTHVQKTNSVQVENYIKRFKNVSSLALAYGLPIHLIRRCKTQMNILKSTVDKSALSIALKHGDFQPNNILVKDNEITVIDTSGYKNDLSIKDVCNFLVGFRVTLIRSLNFMPDHELNQNLQEAFLEGYYKDQTRPQQVIRFFMLLGLMESFEKICSRRGKFLRDVRITPYFTEIMENFLKEEAIV